MITALVPAAGSGERLGADRPKALVSVAGRPLVAWSIRALAAVDGIDEIVVAAAPDARDDVEKLRETLEIDAWREVVDGGAERSDSVRALLEAAGSARVLVHDAARPLVTPEWVARLIDECGDAPAGVPAIPVRDTLKRGRDGTVVETVSREGLFAIQTPQLFDRETLAEAHRAGATAGRAATDDAMLVEAIGVDVRLLTGDPTNLKVTFPGDLPLVESLLPGRSR